jgi:hypothetical protein
MLAEVNNNVSVEDVVSFVGLLIVIGCLIAAAVVAFRSASWIAVGLLLLVAIVAAFLLLA